MTWNIPEHVIRHLIDLALGEDLMDRGDLTSLSTIPESCRGKARIVLKADGVIAGCPLFSRIFSQVDEDIGITTYAEDGAFLPAGTTVAMFTGKMRSMLTAERTLLNFLQRLSGIATMTRHYVHKVSHTGSVILDTRKTTPAMRLLEKYAVRQGGGQNHRTGLYDMILIKDNHIDSCGGIAPAMESCLAYLQQRNLSIPVEVETRNLGEVREALQFPVRRIMLDNMDTETMTEAVGLIGAKAETEASGNITLDTVSAVAETGVDFISVGALTHSVKALDISMCIESF
ncbi:carboxylating nicotinate-nucleotide diphosphorylase [bacterium]|nr:carboxylating nicotinate-nucleotide diphosphorylase [bacterium]